MKHSIGWLLAALALNLFSWAPLSAQVAAGDKPRAVLDDAALFSKEAKEKANSQIARIKRQFKKDLVIETVPSIPIPEGLKKDDVVDAWMAKRYDPLGEDVYVGIVLDPPKYRVHVGAGALKLFTVVNRRELEKILVGHLKAKEMDQAVTDIADFTFEMMRRNGLLHSGLQVIDVKAGTGPGARRGDTLTMHYIGRLKDGKTFDKTTEPITFTLKEGVFIKGFEQGIVGMKAGGMRKLVVPPDLGYGKEGVGDIPAGSELQYEIELLKIQSAKPAAGSTGLKIEDVKEGEGAAVKKGDTVSIHYVGKFKDGKVFDASKKDMPLTFAVGKGRVITGVDEGVLGMKVGGQRKLVIPPDLAYGDEGAGDVIPPGAELYFDVQLLEIVK